jgi:hypothetical protein
VSSAPPGEPAAAQEPPSVRMFLLGGAGGDTVDVLARVLSEQGAPASAIRVWVGCLPPRCRRSTARSPPWSTACSSLTWGS